MRIGAATHRVMRGVVDTTTKVSDLRLMVGSRGETDIVS